MFPMIDKEKTGQRLKRIMKRRGLTPRDVQEYLSLSCVQTVYRWFMGINIPSIDNLYALSRLLGTDMDDMVVGNFSAAEKPAGQERGGDRHMTRLGMYERLLQLTPRQSREVFPGI